MVCLSWDQQAVLNGRPNPREKVEKGIEGEAAEGVRRMEATGMVRRGEKKEEEPGEWRDENNR